MKAPVTFENETLISVDPNSRPMKPFSCLFRFPPSYPLAGKSKSQESPSVPGMHVINNILNYARSLEVLNVSTGQSLYLINN
ncbi:MAG: hypothetical protein R6U64_08305 [Bacteroidales bacterium]